MCAQIVRLTEHLEGTETELSRLTIIRETAPASGYTEEAEAQPDPVIAQPAFRQILVALQHADVVRAPVTCVGCSTPGTSRNTAKACAINSSAETIAES